MNCWKEQEWHALLVKHNTSILASVNGKVQSHQRVPRSFAKHELSWLLLERNLN